MSCAESKTSDNQRNESTRDATTPEIDVDSPSDAISNIDSPSMNSLLGQAVDEISDSNLTQHQNMTT